MQVTIARRFRGPPASGNGGYTCGLVASALQGAVEVTLRKPPPLDVPLTLVAEGDTATLGDVATGAALPLELDVPEPPPYAAAVEAAKRYRGFRSHPYPGCFVCGPERGHGDGLRIFPGRVDGRELVAAPFTPAESIGNDPAIVWAALDCPGYFGALVSNESERAPMLLLGKMHAEVLGELRVGEPHVVIGWSLGVEGRKIFGATALFDSAGRVIGRSRQVWIAPKS